MADTVNTLKVRPRGKRVAILAKPGYTGPLVLPDGVRFPVWEGEVVAIGPGVRHPISGVLIEVEDLAIGDWVRFQPHGGEVIDGNNGREFVIVDEAQISSVEVRDG